MLLLAVNHRLPIYVCLLPAGHAVYRKDRRNGYGGVL